MWYFSHPKVESYLKTILRGWDTDHIGYLLEAFAIAGCWPEKLTVKAEDTMKALKYTRSERRSTNCSAMNLEARKIVPRNWPGEFQNPSQMSNKVASLKVLAESLEKGSIGFTQLDSDELEVWKKDYEKKLGEKEKGKESKKESNCLSQKGSKRSAKKVPAKKVVHKVFSADKLSLDKSSSSSSDEETSNSDDSNSSRDEGVAKKSHMSKKAAATDNMDVDGECITKKPVKEQPKPTRVPKKVPPTHHSAPLSPDPQGYSPLFIPDKSPGHISCSPTPDMDNQPGLDMDLDSQPGPEDDNGLVPEMGNGMSQRKQAPQVRIALSIKSSKRWKRQEDSEDMQVKKSKKGTVIGASFGQ
ncbi:hypothetical protein VNI00_017328 [Paramarasmius palmivorus]|uniref:Uncharacterized protein n=1 Tax=Paramarasmius palmivorus TaxID=297713 RepID=A0AAW0B7A5_9AGAR